MKKIDLGFSAVAIEPNTPADRVHAVPSEFFARNNLSDEAARIYAHYLSRVSSLAGQGNASGPSSAVDGLFKR
jgi:hypothetical protein